MKYIYNDGGRSASNTHDAVADCVTRALSIATHCGYDIAREYLKPLMTPQGVNVFSLEFSQMAYAVGLIYVSTLPRSFKVGQLPIEGVFIAHTSRHVTAVINGVVLDTFDTRDELVQGYWIRKSDKGYNVLLNGEIVNLNPAPFPAACRMIELHALNYSRGEVLTINPNI